VKYENDIRIRTKKFAVRIVKLIKELKTNNVDYPLRDQLLRSGTSIGANVREGKASSSKKELIRFYEIALRSANESDYWMEVIEEGYDFSVELMINDKNELNEISKVLASIIINLKNKLKEEKSQK
jgi:four helix bundle protein